MKIKLAEVCLGGVIMGLLYLLWVSDMAWPVKVIFLLMVGCAIGLIFDL